MSRTVWIAVLAAAVAGGFAALALLQERKPVVLADPGNAQQVAAGQAIYAAECAGCHGEDLQGQPDWKERRPDGKLPAPPHDASGHTWHHPDQQLFDITKRGVAAIVADYESDMPGFGDKLSDADIWAVLAYIKSRWPAEIQARQAEVSRRAPQ